MKKTRLTVIVFVLIFSFLPLQACFTSKPTPAELMNSAFQAEISIKLGDDEARAVLNAALYKNDGALRDCELVFSSPETLSGIRVERKDGKVRAELSGISVELKDSDAFTRVAELLTVGCTVSSAENCIFNGKDANRIVLSNGNEICFSKDNTPFFASDGKLSVEILSFKLVG